MPRVRALLPAIAPEPLPGPQPVRRDVSSGTEALARGLGQVGDVAARIAQETAREQNRARLQDAWSELGSTRIEIQDTASKQKGRDALETDLVAETRKILGQAADRIGETLPPELKAEWASARRQHELGLEESVQRHVGQEAETYALQQYKGTIDVAQSLGAQGAAAAPPGRPLESGQILEARQSVLNAVAAHTRTWSPEAAAAERMRALTEVHAGVLETLARGGRAPDAAQYLASVRTEMDPIKAAVFWNRASFVRG